MRRSQSFDGDGLGANSQVVIPPHNLDPIWSLKPWPAELEYKGRVYDFPAAPATAWLVILMDQELDLDRILIELSPQGLELMLNQDLDLDVLYEAILQLISTVAARKWWIALRMIGVIRSNWHTLGPEMILAGVDPQVLSLAAWLDVMLVILIRCMDPKEVSMFVSRLELPPPSEMAAEQDRVEEMEMSVEQFLSMR
jgi:hypothetical protein